MWIIQSKGLCFTVHCANIFNYFLCSQLGILPLFSVVVGSWVQSFFNSTSPKIKLSAFCWIWGKSEDWKIIQQTNKKRKKLFISPHLSCLICFFPEFCSFSLLGLWSMNQLASSWLLLRQAEVSLSFVNLSVMSYLLHLPKLYRYLFFCFISSVYSVDFVILKFFIITLFFIFMFFIIMWLLERS